LSSYRLGSYSVISLQRQDAFCFITVVLANNLDAVIEASKLELLVKLDCELVNFDIGCDGSGKHTLHLQRDRSAESHTFRSAERESDFILLVIINKHVMGHGERY